MAFRGALFPAFTLRRLEVVTVFSLKVVVVILMMIMVVVRGADTALTLVHHLVPFTRVIGVRPVCRVPLAMTTCPPHHGASFVSREGREGEERGEQNEKRAFPACEM